MRISDWSSDVCSSDLQDLVDRDVEREWGFEQGGIAGPEPENPLPLPQQPCADCLVADHGALRTSGRTGREDDVCELGTVTTHVGDDGKRVVVGKECGRTGRYRGSRAH